MRRTSLAFLPELRTEAEDAWLFAREILPNNAVWLAEAAGEIVGYVAFRQDFIDHLFVDPGRQGAGIGARLLALAKADTQVLRLWTFQENAQGRRFYERHGFVVERLADGADNEERRPEVLYRWNRGAA